VKFSPAREPLALIPMAMSLAALITVLSHVAMYGAAREADEGAAAHIWQLLMAGQAPLVLFYVVRSLPTYPKRTAQVVALQAGAAIAALAPVYWLGL
jgi:hypothetical protein